MSQDRKRAIERLEKAASVNEEPFTIIVTILAPGVDGGPPVEAGVYSITTIDPDGARTETFPMR